MKSSIATVVAYLDTLELPVSYENRARSESPPPSFTDGRQAMVVGAQLTEFTDKVPPELRAAISDSLLLAQLAADRTASKAGGTAGVFDWYEKYIDVLKGIGWVVVDFEQLSQQVGTQNTGVHNAIIPLVTAMLGPGAIAAGSMIVSLLGGLQTMDAQSKWLTLFDRASQHAQGAKFQVSHVDVAEGAAPVVKLLCFAIDAKHAITQVLFFKFSGDEADLRKATGTFTAERARLLETHPAIAERVKPYILDYVTNVEI
jgi:hypothetical protein